MPPVTTDSYRITIRGTGVTLESATAAFEAAVTSLLGDTIEGGVEPVGTLTHNELVTEQASDV